jgi:prepilin-type N-terminal cleavage/methylation domain-containing protein
MQPNDDISSAVAPARPPRPWRLTVWPCQPAGTPKLRGFTLIELMIVIGIASLIIAIGIPPMFRAMHRDPMRQSVNDLLEACSQARARAVMNGVMTELVFHPQDRTFEVVSGSVAASPDSGPAPMTASSEAPADSAPADSTGSSGRIAEQLVIEMLDVNFQERKDEEIARVRFFPNGTSDEFTIVLQWPQEQKFRKITLDILTGLADVEVIR